MIKLNFSVAGDPESFSLENRILNGACFAALLISISTLFINSFSDFPLFITISLVIIATAYLMLYYFSRIKRITTYIKFLFFLSTLYVLSIGWFVSEGVYGSMPYYYFITLFTFLMMSNPGTYKYIITLFIIYVSVLILIQIRYPQFILPFQTRSTHFFDLSTSLIMGLFALSFLGITVKRNYNLERMKVERQKTELERAYLQISQKNKSITESLNYAKYIQEAMLPFESRISESISEYFILYKPKDIVSGDFYWFHDTGSRIIIAAADCTGHGVPGAFMSMIGSDLLNHVIKFQQIIQPDKILFELHKGIVHALKQTESENRDGIDIAICCFEKNLKKLEFSGANRPLYIIQNNNFQEVNGDNKTIGDYADDHAYERFFTNHIVDLSGGVTFYIFTDGYIDQFGGYENKKFSKTQFKELLLQINQKSMSEQKQILSETFDHWKTRSQTDDVLVIGVKLSKNQING